MGPGDEVDWLRSDLEESPVIAVKKKSLVNKLDDLARRKFMLKFNLRFLLFTEDQHHSPNSLSEIIILGENGCCGENLA